MSRQQNSTWARCARLQRPRRHHFGRGFPGRTLPVEPRSRQPRACSTSSRKRLRETMLLARQSTKSPVAGGRQVSPLYPQDAGDHLTDVGSGGADPSNRLGKRDRAPRVRAKPKNVQRPCNDGATTVQRVQRYPGHHGQRPICRALSPGVPLAMPVGPACSSLGLDLAVCTVHGSPQKLTDSFSRVAGRQETNTHQRTPQSRCGPIDQEGVSLDSDKGSLPKVNLPRLGVARPY
jgi:hypothetical protein